MKYKALFYQKNNEKYSRLLSAAVVIGTLRVKTHCVDPSSPSITNPVSAITYKLPEQI